MKKSMKEKANNGGYLVKKVINPYWSKDPEKDWNDHKAVLKIGDQVLTKNNWECIAKALGSAIATCDEKSEKYEEYLNALMAIDRLVFIYGYLKNMGEIKND